MFNIYYRLATKVASQYPTVGTLTVYCGGLKPGAEKNIGREELHSLTKGTIRCQLFLRQ